MYVKILKYFNVNIMYILLQIFLMIVRNVKK